MNLTINLQNVKRYSWGLTDISDSWNDVPAKDIYTYEVFDIDNPVVKTTFKVLDTKDKEDYHIKLFNAYAEAIEKLIDKLNLYNDLTQDEKDILNKFKNIFEEEWYGI